MKEYSKILLLIAALMLAGLAAFASVTFSYHGNAVDTLYVNDLVQTVREHWGTLDEMDADRFQTEMLVFNSDAFLVYAADVQTLSEIHTPEEAIRDGCLCLAVHEGSRFLGTIVIPSPAKISFTQTRRKIMVTAGALMLIFLLIACLYGLYVHRTIIRPFRKMERFAENVAAGMLDEPLMQERSNMFGAFTESFDIMREELRNARRREAALKMKEKEMVASLSHDLKTPITGIKLLCELLTVKVKDGYVLEKIENIHQKAEQISVLVSDLLSSVLDDLGEMHVDCHDEPSDMLHELVEEHDTRALVREEEIPGCLICADRIRLSQVIGNIISNSYKYAGTAIDIGYRVRDGYLEMTVRDHGQGVAEEEIGLVTAKFYRGGNASGKDGSGLGLYIAEKLMEKMNGELICSSRETGFQVMLLIPLS